MFADLTGFTSLTEERGDEVAAALATRLAALADDVALRHASRLVKLLGDGVMLHFQRPIDAVRAALELRGSMHPAGLPATHIGIDAGALMCRDSDFYGRTVNIAARLAGVAGPGEILVSEALVRAVRATGGEIHGLVELPALELKGIPGQIAAHRVQMAEHV